MARLTVFLLLLFSTFISYAQGLSANELLDRSIAFHDPDDKWADSRMEFVIEMQIPNRPLRPSKVVIDNEKGTFHLSMVRQGRLLEWMVDAKDSCEFKVDFASPSQASEADSLQLTADRARRWRNYYSYLYGLPMKLKDEGTIIDPAVQETQFMGKDVLAIKVTYDEAVGKDTWYFYFNPGTYAMIGYRFYHDEAKNDGEYIILDGIEIQNGLRIPKDRSWYTNAEDRLLGTDYLKQLNVTR